MVLIQWGVIGYFNLYLHSRNAQLINIAPSHQLSIFSWWKCYNLLTIWEEAHYLWSRGAILSL